MGLIGTDHATGIRILGGSAGGVITPAGMYSLGKSLGFISAAATGWGAANLAVYWPFRLTEQAVAYQIVFGCGVTAGGNVSVGIYDSEYNRLVSATAARVASNEIIVNITDTVLLPGLYWGAMALDGTNNVVGYALSSAPLANMMGFRQESSAYPLPDPMTPVAMTTVVGPAMGIWLRSE